MAKSVAVKGRWFDGDRTVEQQLTGLERLWPEVVGKTVLDVGCAEGDIAIECARHGAEFVLGIEVRMDAIKAARAAAIRCDAARFQHVDVNDSRTALGPFDIVLLLAVLHKLRDPTAAARRFAATARELVVIRLPPEHAPTIIDTRSGGVLHDIERAMRESGFVIEHAGYDGPFGEWIGYYRRNGT